jgi:hypothetical protein
MEQSKNIIQLINELDELKNELPIDWLGSSGEYKIADKEKREWNNKWDNIINEINKTLNQ